MNFHLKKIQLAIFQFVTIVYGRIVFDVLLAKVNIFFFSSVLENIRS